MRIIAGKAGRIAIKVPPAVTRPTTDYVRQAIFSILGETVFDARVLDLFCGSGAIGLEALSRGATSCLFVDEHRQAVSTTKQNLEKSRLEGGRILQSEAISFITRDTASYDLIFADPPYWKHALDKDHVKNLLAVPNIADRLTPGGHLIAEISSSQSTPPSPHLTLVDRREYSNCAILIFSRPDS